MAESMIYTDPEQTVEARVADLLQRMTLEEKIGQMCQIDGRQNPEWWIRKKYVGSFLHVIGPLAHDLQRLAEESRLGIPLLFGIDAIHGHAFCPTATIFPTQLSLSSSWNPELLQEVGRITATEVAGNGVHWTFSPVLGTVRDLRWGRVDETCGEDPYINGVLGSALIRGYQGDNLADADSILACAKHYAGYSDTVGGRDSSESELSKRYLKSLFLRPFQAAVEAGCQTIMAGYQAVDGTPCSANTWLLKDVLRKEFGFHGMVITDWDNIGHMHNAQKVCATLEEAVQRAVEAGNDMMMSTPDFPDLAGKLVKRGILNEAQIDIACRRILRLKFQLGLFDHNRYQELDTEGAVIGCPEHRQAALESAYQSIVLLKNEENLLPLNDSITRIAVIGPNADNVLAQLGDWTFQEIFEQVLGKRNEDLPPAPRDDIVTVLRGIRERVPEGCEVDYCPGCRVMTTGCEEIEAATETAAQADVAIVVVGDTVAQNGERRDRGNLDLSGVQQQLLEAVHATGTPLVVVLLNGKPLSIPWVKEHAGAIVEAWNPGIEGGSAVAGVLFGDRNPGGKLTVSFPYHVGQLPVYYNQIPGWHAPNYVDMPEEPLWPFGYGLSYTTFQYRKLKLSSKKLRPGENLRVDVIVKNTGERAGSDVVQLYINDLYSSVTTPVKELKAFQRVELQPGEQQTVSLEVGYQQLALVNRELETVVEPGEFEVMVGNLSQDEGLLKARFEVKA